MSDKRFIFISIGKCAPSALPLTNCKHTTTPKERERERERQGDRDRMIENVQRKEDWFHL